MISDFIHSMGKWQPDYVFKEPQKNLPIKM